MTKKPPVLAWHFTGDKLRDGRPIPAIGEPLRHVGRIVPCEAGLHASIAPFDALQYAPGAILHRVACSGRIVTHGDDKIACRQRTIIATVDATALLRRFACDQAIEALRLAAITPPQSVADYLRTADAALRSAARSAAESAAESAARSAAESAAWRAAESAARSAAESAAWSAARSAAWSAAESAARSAAESAAWSAAWSAARTEFNRRAHTAFGIEEG